MQQKKQYNQTNIYTVKPPGEPYCLVPLILLYVMTVPQVAQTHFTRKRGVFKGTESESK